MRITSRRNIYESPHIITLEMEAEKGFSASTEIGNEKLNENEGIW